MHEKTNQDKTQAKPEGANAPELLPAVVRRSVTAKTQFNTDRLELKEHRYKNVTIRVWKRSDGNWSIAPYLFAIQMDGEQERQFTGVPNYCESRQKAYMKARHRAKWLHDGIWNKHYTSTNNTILPGVYTVT